MGLEHLKWSAESDPEHGGNADRVARRPRAHLLAFGVRHPVPDVPVPLRRDETEPVVGLGGLLAALYDRAGYDLRIDYRRPPEPPLDEADAAWAEERLRDAESRSA